VTRALAILRRHLAEWLQARDGVTDFARGYKQGGADALRELQEEIEDALDLEGG